VLENLHQLKYDILHVYDTINKKNKKI